MEQISTSQRLQNAVLRVAARDRSGLDFTRAARRKVFYGAFPEGAISSGQQVLILGVSDESTLQFAAQSVGPNGTIRVIECNEALIERGQEYATQLGDVNWSFERAALDDLSTNPAFLASFLTEHPVSDVRSYQDLQDALELQRREHPWLATEKTDVVIIDQVLNRVAPSHSKSLLAEAWRVLAPGGRVLIRLLLADEPVPVEAPTLPDGTVLHAAPGEAEIATLLQASGYYGMRYTWRGDLPVKVVQGVELRSFVVEAYKQPETTHIDRGHAVIYRGPWKEVHDDAGHSYLRGERMAVSEATYQQLLQAPYQQDIFGIPCYLEIRAEEAPLFPMLTQQIRDPKVTKGSKSIFDDQGSCGCSSTSDCGCS